MSETCAHCGEEIVVDEWVWTHTRTAIAHCLPRKANGQRYSDGDVVALLLCGGLPMSHATAEPWGVLA